MAGRKAVFIDRDGVLNQMVYDPDHGLMDSPRRADQVQLVKGAGEFLRQLGEWGYLRIVVTNQPGFAKGTLTDEDLKVVNGRLAELLAQDGGEWDDLRYCPHHPDGGPWRQEQYVMDCDCRKPKPGLLLDAAQTHGVDVSRSWMIGDGLSDVAAGQAAGCRTILLARLKVNLLEKHFDLGGREPDAIVPTLEEALNILSPETAKG
jgi:D-glycero-D-manno-heptose 1,7-bisphosphate phosphatase